MKFICILFDYPGFYVFVTNQEMGIAAYRIGYWLDENYAISVFAVFPYDSTFRDEMVNILTNHIEVNRAWVTLQCFILSEYPAALLRRINYRYMSFLNIMARDETPAPVYWQRHFTPNSFRPCLNLSSCRSCRFDSWLAYSRIRLCNEHFLVK
jgi:hypothetical protein